MNIITPRLRLRPIRESDIDAIFAMRSDIAVTRYLNHAPFTERAQAERRVANLMQVNDDRTWAIALPGDDRLIGTVTLFSFVREHKRCELGYELAPSAQGRGYAIEAVRAALTHAFSVEGMERIEADVDPRNAPSRRLVERLGFKLEGTLRARWYVNGEVCDASFYGLLRHEFVADSHMG